ncbi:taperin-like [Podarcis raffonei]|uniref:taperin-like n=1 Tax=Podarcis raffonei TaxID=65483 RepID=UPI0023296934|nr:taperin-like [Podarcis raffonei]
MEPSLLPEWQRALLAKKRAKAASLSGLLELYSARPGVRTLRAERIVIVELREGEAAYGGGDGAAELRAEEVLLYQPEPGRVRLLRRQYEKEKLRMSEGERGSPRMRPSPPQKPMDTNRQNGQEEAPGAALHMRERHAATLEDPLCVSEAQRWQPRMRSTSPQNPTDASSRQSNGQEEAPGAARRMRMAPSLHTPKGQSGSPRMRKGRRVASLPMDASSQKGEAEAPGAALRMRGGQDDMRMSEAPRRVPRMREGRRSASLRVQEKEAPGAALRMRDSDTEASGGALRMRSQYVERIAANSFVVHPKGRRAIDPREGLAEGGARPGATLPRGGAWTVAPRTMVPKESAWAPDATFPKRTAWPPAPGATFPKQGAWATAPHTTLPKEGARAPAPHTMHPKEGAWSDATVPKGSAWAAAPDSTVPKALPDATVPKESAWPPSPDATVPKASACMPSPDATVPKASACMPSPDATVPKASAWLPSPDATVPKHGAWMPSPDATVPKQSAWPPSPGATVPNESAWAPSDCRATTPNGALPASPHESAWPACYVSLAPREPRATTPDPVAPPPGARLRYDSHPLAPNYSSQEGSREPRATTPEAAPSLPDGAHGARLRYNSRRAFQVTPGADRVPVTLIDGGATVPLAPLGVLSPRLEGCDVAALGPGFEEFPAPGAEGDVARYPRAEEIEVIGGYLSLERSCMRKGGARRRKKLKISFDDLHTMFEYPSETSLEGQEEEEEAEEEEEEEEEEYASEVDQAPPLPVAKRRSSAGNQN